MRSDSAIIIKLLIIVDYLLFYDKAILESEK